MIFYRKDPKLSLEKFLLSLLRDIYDFHMYQRTGTTAKVPLYLFFAEARREGVPCLFGRLQVEAGGVGQAALRLNNSKTKFCRLFDFTSLTDGVKRQDDFFLSSCSTSSAPASAGLSPSTSRWAKSTGSRRRALFSLYESLPTVSVRRDVLAGFLHEANYLRQALPFQILEEMIFPSTNNVVYSMHYICFPYSMLFQSIYFT